MAPPTAAPDASVSGLGSISDVMLTSPPVIIRRQTAPIRAKMTMLCISIFALDADYSLGIKAHFLLKDHYICIIDLILFDYRGLKIFYFIGI